MKCIYCLDEKEAEEFSHKEHIIPECLGKFNNNLTLNCAGNLLCVCNDCNQYFGDTFELILGRDSMEGIARYRFGLSPKSPPFYRRLKLSAIGPSRLKGVHVVPKIPSGAGTDELEIESQVGFFNSRQNEYVYFKKNEIPDRDELEKQGYILHDKEIFFYGEVEELAKLLKDKGMNVKIGDIKNEIADVRPGLIPVLVQGRIDRDLCRAMAKIAFNYLAYNQGPVLALKENFNGIRQFIKNGCGKGKDYVEIDTKPILYVEIKRKKRKFCGHIVFLDWRWPEIIVRISLYNSIIGLTYTVILCRNYPIWFPISKAHYFDPNSKDVKELTITQQIALP